MPPRTPVYQLKITLQESRPPIWRRILVPANIALDRLHIALQIVMGWEDCHLHQFIADGTHYSIPHPEDYREVADERRIRLNRLLKQPDERVVYEYDFGDGWRHSLVLEEIIKTDVQLLSPVCTGGERSCPPEDSGGMGGYDRFLEALADPRHPEHRDMRQWIGGSFDPEAFNLATVNAYLQRLR